MTAMCVAGGYGANVIVQSRHPIRSARDFTRAPKLCGGACSFTVTEVGDQVTLTVIDLLPYTRYFYALAARDNISGRGGPRSKTVVAKTGRPITDDGPPSDHEDTPHRHRASCSALS